MKAIVRRLLMPEVLATPELNERGETLGDVIRARSKRHFEEPGEAIEDWPQARFAGALSIGEIILRSRQLYRDSTRPGSALGAREQLPIFTNNAGGEGQYRPRVTSAAREVLTLFLISHTVQFSRSRLRAGAGFPHIRA